MTCQDCERQLSDYVDGALAPAARAALEAHVGTCASCRVLLADLDAIRSLAASLPPHAPPPRVWARLSAQLGVPRRRSFAPMSLFAWPALGTAAVALMLTTGLWWVGERLRAVSPVPGAGVSASAGPAAAPADVVQVAGEAQYARAIATLEEAALAERSALDPRTASELDAGLTVIDEAIVESRTALESDPDSDVAQDSLFEALRQKVELLQFTLALVNEMRKGNEDGAARVISELNP